MAQSHCVVPVIQTERIRLRPHTIDDFASMARMWGDPETNRYIGGKPPTQEETWARLLRYAGHWALLGFGYWLVEEKTSRDYVGEVGFSDYRRDMDPPLREVLEVGWVLSKAKQGKGYATEAVLAALDWGRKYWGSATVACIIHPDHCRSITVAEKCGFGSRQHGTYKGAPTIILERTL